MAARSVHTMGGIIALDASSIAGSSRSWASGVAQEPEKEEAATMKPELRGTPTRWVRQCGCVTNPPAAPAMAVDLSFGRGDGGGEGRSG